MTLTEKINKSWNNQSLFRKTVYGGFLSCFLGVVIYGAGAYVKQVLFDEVNEVKEKQEQYIQQQRKLIEESDKQVVFLTKQLESNLDINNNQIIELTELRLFLDSIGYTSTINNNTNIQLYNPNRLRPRWELGGVTFIRETERDDIFRSRNTVYIPIEYMKDRL